MSNADKPRYAKCRVCKEPVGRKGDSPARSVGRITKVYIHARCMVANPLLTRTPGRKAG